jgi:signal transduction histidine kinase/CheY-like chemotaxis protein
MSSDSPVNADHEQALLRIATSSTMAGGDLESLYALVTRTAAEVLGVERVSVWFLRDHDTHLCCATLYRRSADDFGPMPTLDASKYPAYFAALESGRTVVADDAQTDPRTRELGTAYLGNHEVSSILDAPVRIGGRVVGVVCHEHVGPSRSWRPDEIAFAGALADQIAQARLHADHASATENYRRLKEELEVTRRHETLGRLAAGVMHDLNNLMFCVLANAELLSEATLTPAEGESLEELRGAGHRSSALLGKLLQFGGRVRRDERVDIGPVIANLAPLLRRLAPADVDIRCHLPLGVHEVRCARGAIEQVVLNLVVNARDAVGDRGSIDVELTWVETEAGVPSPPIAVPAARITVRDDGPGVPEGAAEWIFQPFFSTKPEENGTGLGLSTARGLVEAVGGTIELGSPARGAEFVVWLPAAVGDPTPPRAPAPRPARAIAAPVRRRALIAEDEPAARRVLSELLQREGYEVLAVADGLEAVAVFDALRHPPDLLVFDRGMPRLDGAGALRELLARAPETPAILVSGEDLDADEFVCLAKPFTRGSLAAAIARATAAVAERRGSD